MQILIEIDENMYQKIKGMENLILKNRTFKSLELAVLEGKVLPEHHGDLKDIGNMELLNVQVHDDYSKGWHNAIEYCVRQLRERPTIIPATKESARTMLDCYKCKNNKADISCEKCNYEPATKEGDGE